MPNKVPTNYRYCTLEEARALTCNRCGDCCDSRSLEKERILFSWGTLPKHQYRGMGKGQPLIIPLELVDDKLIPRQWEQRDATQGPAGFMCSQFSTQDGHGSCGLRDSKRPLSCGQFPVSYPKMGDELIQAGYLRLRSDQFSRCKWGGMLLLHEQYDEILSHRNEDYTVRYDELTEEWQTWLKQYHNVATGADLSGIELLAQAMGVEEQDNDIS